jgi:geranylgeranyl diphosphate synthase type II
MHTINELQNKVSKRLEEINFNKHPVELYEPISYILSIGGKRIRPTLTLMAANLFSDEIDLAIDPAIGLEVFHNFTLMHDDIMDNADIRRNQPTVHKKWDENVAILSGDAMMIKSYDFFYVLPDSLYKRTMRIFNQMALEVCEGQQYDMNFEKTLNVSVDDYIEMIRLKTSVLLSACLKIGGLIGGANDDQAEMLYEFGKYMGLAFQLKDDLLDTYGNIEKFGKMIGGDIVSNKKTYLLINALNTANSEQLERLKMWVQRDRFDSTEKINEVTKIYNELEIKEKTLKQIEAYHKSANSILDKLEIQENRKSEIRLLTQKIMIRDF